MENMNLIRKLAWSFHNTTGIDFDDLVGEATLAYYENLTAFDPSQDCKFTTYIYRCMKNRLVDYIRAEKYRTTVDIETVTKHPSYNMENDFAIDELFHGDAREVVEMVIEAAETPAVMLQSKRTKRRTEKKGFIDFDQCPKFIRGQIVQELRNRGWKWDTIWSTMAEIKTIINQN